MYEDNNLYKGLIMEFGKWIDADYCTGCGVKRMF